MTATWALHDLPALWAGRATFTAMHLGPGATDALIALWALWQRDPNRCEMLYLVADKADCPDDTADLDGLLRAAWPVTAPGWHDVALDGGRVRWLLRLGRHAGDDWGQIVARADAVAGVPDGDAPNDRWTADSARTLSRLVAPEASLLLGACADPSRDAAQRAALRSAGFTTDAAGGTAFVLRYRPVHTARRPPSRGIGCYDGSAHVLIVGGGLAGCAVAEALAAIGRTSTIVDRHPHAAGEASGNAAGLFHGIVTPDDGHHARFNRAAALATQRRVADAIDQDGVAGSADGLLRLQTTTSDPHHATLAAMRDTVGRLGLPASYVQALDRAAACERAGLRVDVPAWWFPGGGWVDPGALARSMLRRAGGFVTWHGGTTVASMARIGALWVLLDPVGGQIDAAPIVVLANAADAHRLLGRPAWLDGRMTRSRGQLSCAPADMLPGVSPRVPLTGAGYLLPAQDGTLWFGATSHPDDDEVQLRPADHAFNLRRLHALTGTETAAVDPASLDGRTAWRWLAADRLPLVGAVPEPVARDGCRQPDQPRRVPRIDGLYLHAALGGRGITWATLGGRLLAAIIAGDPLPLAANLVDAVDPARFVARDARHARGPAG